jgi:hypothetical protein
VGLAGPRRRMRPSRSAQQAQPPGLRPRVGDAGLGDRAAGGVHEGRSRRDRAQLSPPSRPR